MAPTELTKSTRYTDQATTVVYFLPTIASTDLVPTRTEMDAGTDLSIEINDISGWTVESDQIDTQSLGETFTSQIPGSTSSPDSDLTFYTSRDGADVRALLPRNTTGFVMFCDGGDVPGNIAEVYPVTVTSVGVMRTSDGSEASKVKISFSVTREPAQGVTIPAAV